MPVGLSVPSDGSPVVATATSTSGSPANTDDGTVAWTTFPEVSVATLPDDGGFTGSDTASELTVIVYRVF